MIPPFNFAILVICCVMYYERSLITKGTLNNHSLHTFSSMPIPAQWTTRQLGLQRSFLEFNLRTHRQLAYSFLPSFAQHGCADEYSTYHVIQHTSLRVETESLLRLPSHNLQDFAHQLTTTTYQQHTLLEPTPSSYPLQSTIQQHNIIIESAQNLTFPPHSTLPHPIIRNAPATNSSAVDINTTYPITSLLLLVVLWYDMFTQPFRNLDAMNRR